jgi:uncharacterized damage-inducible protein DinB
MQRPKQEESIAYFHNYIRLVQDGNIMDILKNNHAKTQNFIKNIPVEKENYSYAEGKWTVKEALLHLIDTERILAYRALRFARNDETDLQGFDQDIYVPTSNAANRTLEDIAEEFQTLRASTLSMVQHFTPEMVDRNGTTNGNIMSVRALIYIIAGHELHHMNVFKERYF